MPIQCLFFFLLLIRSAFAIPQSTEFKKYAGDPRLFSAEELLRSTTYRLSKPLIGEDGRIYTCSERYLLAFESNGSILWSTPLNYTCNAGIAPIHGGRGKIYLFAKNRVLKINFSNIGTSESAA